MRFLVVTLALITVSMAVAQPNPDTLWTRTYGTSGDERAYCVRQTTDGGYIITGWGWGNFRVVKTDSMGEIQWTDTYGYLWYTHETSGDIQQTANGGYIVAGTTHYNMGGTDIYVVKLNSYGITQWRQAYIGEESQRGQSIQQTSDGGYIVAGLAYEPTHDFYLLKIDGDGDEMWSRQFGGLENEWCYSVRQTTDEGYILAGYTESFGAGGFDYYLVKTDPNGDTLWTHTYGGYYDDRGYAVLQTSDGGYIMAGESVSYGLGPRDGWVVKTNSVGDIEWTQTVGGYSVRSIDYTSDGGYIIAGRTEYAANNNYDIYLVKIDSLGNILWNETYGGENQDYAYSVQQTTDGGYIIAGNTDSFGFGNDDIYLIKTGPFVPSGVQQEPVTFSPYSVTLYPNYPNPFNSSTTIPFGISSPGLVQLDVYNIQGKKVARLLNGFFQSGRYRTQFHADQLVSGIYVVRLQSHNVDQTRRILFIK